MQARRLAILLMTALAALALGACGGDDGNGAGDGGGTITVQLQEQNNSGQSGTATLEEAPGQQTTVNITLSNPTGVDQPAFIHLGTCQNLQPEPPYQLARVSNGSSQTTIVAAINEFRSGEWALTVATSDEQFDKYVACGNISTG